MKTSKLTPIKRLGQNFLQDDKVINAIVKELNINPKTNYIEIGPGAGALTIPVSKVAKKFVAVEIDKQVTSILKLRVGDKVKIINQDFLKFDVESYLDESNIIFGNLPYYITTELIEKISEYSNKIDFSLIMIQSDVAAKILNLVSGKSLTYLGLMVNYLFTPTLILNVSPNSFFPSPNVDSTVIKLVPKRTLSKADVIAFQKFLIAILKQRRKTLLNNLKELNLDELKMSKINKLVKDLSLRVEALNPDQIYRIFEIVK